MESVYAQYRSGTKSFMDFCQCIAQWVAKEKFTQTHALEALRSKGIPIQFIAKAVELKGCEFQWNEKKCDYQLVVVVARSLDAVGMLYLFTESLNYGLDLSNGLSIEKNKRNLDNAGWTIAKTDSIEDVIALNPTQKFAKY